MKIVIAGSYGAGNLGDELILQGLLLSLKQLKNAEITVLSGNPQETERKHNVRSVPMVPAGFRSLLKTFKNNSNKTEQTIKETDYFILGGGGLFGSLNLKSYFIWFRQLWPAIRHKKKILILGQSIGKINNVIKRLIVKYCFQKASFISVRDQESKQTLLDLGTKSKIHVYPDFIFQLGENITQQKAKKQKTTIISLRQKDNITKQFIAEISQFCNWLIKEKGQQIRFLDFQKGGAQRDSLLHKKIINNIKDCSAIKHLTEVYSYPKAQQIFSSSNCVIGMRLHSLLLAIKSATPYIAISYAPKVSNYLKQLNTESQTIEEHEITFENLKARYEKLRKNREKLRNDLKSYSENAKRELLNFNSLLHTFLDSAR